MSVKVGAAEVAALLDRYGRNPFEAMGRDYNTDAELAAGYFAAARAILPVAGGGEDRPLVVFQDFQP